MRARQLPSHQAFTLVELLVVSVIIALLVGVLIPSLAAARKANQRAVCLSNLKQIGIAIHGYASDNHATIPFGPTAPPVTSAADFYPCTGSPTSLLSLFKGAPVGLGLLLGNQLANQPKVLFCPGNDQPVNAGAQLANVGTTQAQGSYFYRHGSIPASTPAAAAALTPVHIRLDDLGNNRNGQPIQALAMDADFLCPASLANWGVYTSTQHQTKFVDILFSDGHAVAQANSNGGLTVDLSNPVLWFNPFINPFDNILGALEDADGQP
jgi:prepilin-type N-terminal cleavage/methylation domain-containing protein